MSDISILFESDTDDVEISSFEGNGGSGGLNASKKTEDKTMKAIKIIMAVLVVFGIFEFGFYKFIRPCLGYPKVAVEGNENYSSAEIVEMLKPMNVKNWLNFSADSAASIISSASGIDSVTVRKVFPDKIYINVFERQPVAMTFINQNGRSLAVQIDKTGVLFPEHSFDSVDFSTVPIVSGLPVEHLTEGMRIPQKYRTLIEQISSIRKMGQKYFAAISEICVIPKEYGNYELMLIPEGSKIKVLTDRTLNEEALKYMMVALDVVNSIDSNVSEIDLRYGAVSYRKR